MPANTIALIVDEPTRLVLPERRVDTLLFLKEFGVSAVFDDSAML